jgi:outer membrane protein OmpA-like peptidoglycan-associated protein
MGRTELRLLGVVIVLIGAGGGCATKQGTGALIGGGVGAGIGAAIGALAGGGKGAVVGGAVGAAAGTGSGALIGRYMDKQEVDLRQVKAANVERQGDKLIVRFNSAILFGTGKAALKPQSQQDLAEFASVLRTYPDTELMVEGHTDNTGKRDSNQKLFQSRAQSVLALLESQGIVRARLTVRGWADDRPIADNATEEGRAQNRRVEIDIAANERLRRQDAAAAQQQADAQPQTGPHPRVASAGAADSAANQPWRGDGKTGSMTSTAIPDLSPADQAAAFKAAGFIEKGGHWVGCEGESTAEIEAKDINGDGKMDFIITDSGTSCYGDVGQGFFLMTKTAAGAWQTAFQSEGIPDFLKTKAHGWPDIEIGGPGFCFPIVRWNGKTYAFYKNHESRRGACVRQ